MARDPTGPCASLQKDLPLHCLLGESRPYPHPSGPPSDFSPPITHLSGCSEHAMPLHKPLRGCP